MASFQKQLDNPPETSDVNTLRAYINDMYEVLSNVLSNIDEENLNDDFISKLNGGAG